jgi:MinD-like ATPase involved in chromosome partitioning or flagellar assembly
LIAILKAKFFPNCIDISPFLFIVLCSEVKDMKKIVLATGITQLDDQLRDRIKKDVQFVGSVLFREGLEDVVSRKNPDIIILSELLDGVTPMRELILKIRTRFPEVRIIYFMKEENKSFKAFLYHWHVFDVFAQNINIALLEESIGHAKQFKDVSGDYDELKEFEKEAGMIDTSDPDEFRNMNPGNGINAPATGNSTLYNEIIAFWSILDQSARTFSMINTGLMLASNKQLKILMLDFNTENPNIHLQFGFVPDPEKNLGAIIEDLDDGIELSKESFDNYLIAHPTYKNLKILPGQILKNQNRNQKQLYDLLENIIIIAEQSNYSTILIDINSGLRDELTINILKKVSKILLHVAETPGSLYAVRRCFDSEAGLLVANLIDKKKITPIITLSQPDTQANFQRHLYQAIELRTGAIIDYHAECRESVLAGEPLLTKKPSDDMYSMFVRISNLIHKNIFVDSIKRPAAIKLPGGKNSLANLLPSFLNRSKSKK